MASICFGKNAEKWYIPRIWRDFLDALAFECNTYQLRAEPVMTVAEECKSAIEVTPSHADTVSKAVECNEWGYYYVDVIGVDGPAG